jgi:hypothetical protein
MVACTLENVACNAPSPACDDATAVTCWAIPVNADAVPTRPEVRVGINAETPVMAGFETLLERRRHHRLQLHELALQRGCGSGDAGDADRDRRRRERSAKLIRPGIAISAVDAGA